MAHRVPSLRLALAACAAFVAPLALVVSCVTGAGEDGSALDGGGPSDGASGADTAPTADGGPSDGTTPTDVVSTDGGARIGPAGGTVVTSDGVVVTIPAGALDTDREIRVTATAEGAPSAFRASSALYRFEPAGLTFKVPITVAFPPPASPGMVLWSNGGDSDFGVLESTLTDGKLTVHPSHFSAAFVGVLVFSMSPSGGQLTVSRAAARYVDAGLAAPPDQDAGYLPVLQLRYPLNAVTTNKTFTLAGSPGTDPAFDAYLFGKVPSVRRDQDRLSWYWDLEPAGVAFDAPVDVTMALSSELATPMPPAPNVIASAYDGKAWTNGQELGFEQYFPPYVGRGDPLLYGHAAPVFMSGFFTALHECGAPLIFATWGCGCMDPANPDVKLPSGPIVDRSVSCHGSTYQLFGEWTVGGARTSTLVMTCSHGAGSTKTCTVVGTMVGCTCPSPSLQVEYDYDGDCHQDADAGVTGPPNFTAVCGW